jgi:enamine deaminase RidA (YjgF/YER057c/UK114 family)
VSYDSAGNIVGVGDLKKQTEQVYENIGRALEAAGATFADVVKSIILIKQMTPEKVITVRDVRQNYLTDTPPTSTLISVDTLIKPELLVEIEVVAIPADDR